LLFRNGGFLLSFSLSGASENSTTETEDRVAEQFRDLGIS
jgi:hypothetical protein